MNTPSSLRHSARLVWALTASSFLSIAGAQAAQYVVRPDYQNLTPSTYTPREAGVIIFPGHRVTNGTPLANIPTNNAGQQLRESSFGQPFAPYIPRMSTNDIRQPYAAEVAAAVLAKLYPAPGASKAAVDVPVAQGGAAFRYQWLLFGPQTNAGVIRTVADFEGIARWFGPAERALVDQQITNVMDALAISPWDTTLRRTLLDCYTDRAIAEMQYNKCDLVELGKKRLGLTLTGQFIIDDEILLISNVVSRLQGVLGKYNQLFTCAMDGVEPADFDTRFPRGTPFGYYVFATEQPARNTMAPQAFNTNGTLVLIPDFDPVLKEVLRGDPEPFNDASGNGFFDAGESFTDLNTNGLYDSGSVIFSGYKDYTTLLNVLAEYVQRSAELARYLGMRRGPGDLTRARGIITDLQKKTATDYALLRKLFAGVTFPPGDASGVNAVLGATERAFAESVNTRSFLQGSGNILGLDNNFMVFLQDGSGVTDTYDQMKPLVFSDLNSATPVKAALLEQGFARVAYENFRASVDQVVEELADVKSTFDNRFEDITGYTVAEINQFNGLKPKPGVASDLATLDRTIENLYRRNTLLFQRASQFLTDLAGANTAVTLAEGIATTINNAEQSYLDNTASAWSEIHGWAGGMAASQAVADGMYAASGLDGLATVGSGGANLALVVVATVANTVVQTAGATRTSQRQQELDTASIGFQSELAAAEAPLTAQQTRQELGALLREQFAARIEVEDNNTALAQALADRTRLVREVESIKANFEANQASIRSRFYADPLHLVRSDNAILTADAAFANAQRWMFYLIRALEYKWNQNFVGFFANRNYDAGSIFKMRNAEELKDLFNALENFNSSGRLNFAQNTDQFTTISLRRLLTPNPNALALFDQFDPGVRVDQRTGETVTEREMFRRQLRRLVDTNGNLVIPVNTTRLSEIDYPDFFLGPLYANNGAILREGRWHDVVRYVKVNLVYPSHVGATPLAVSGKITYSGLTLFRTRVAPCGLPANRLLNTQGDARNIPGELFATPFRSYVNLDFTVPFFEVRDRKEESRPFARSRDYVRNLNPPLLDPLTDNYKSTAFTEYSVAATGWELTLFATPNVNLDLIEDIEFIVAHRSADREQVSQCP